MKTVAHHPLARPCGGAVLGTALLAAAACLLGACGGAGEAPMADAEANAQAGVTADQQPARNHAGRQAALAHAGDPSVQVVVLDMDRLGSPEAVVQRATQERGAPGEAERVVYLVRARRPADAERGVDALVAEGFEWVAPVWAPYGRTARTARSARPASGTE